MDWKLPININHSSGSINKCKHYDRITNKFADIAANNMRLTDIGNLDNFIKESLITKRTEFGHEEEVRIVHRFGTNGTPRPLNISKDFDPNSFFEELVLDPRADNISVNNAKDLLSALGANPAIIKKSSLYHLNKYTLTI